MEKSRCVLQFGVVYVGYDSIRSFLKKKKKKRPLHPSLLLTGAGGACGISGFLGPWWPGQLQAAL